MAQATKTKRDSKGKSTPKAKTRFYVVKTTRQAKKNLARRLDAYNQKFIYKPLGRGKTLACDFKKEPGKTIDDLFEDGKAYITDLNKETRSTVGGMIKDGNAFLSKAGKAPRQTLSGVLADGKSLIVDIREDTRERMDALKAETQSLLNGIGKDSRLAVDEVVTGGKHTLDKITGKLKIEKEVRSRIRTLPAQFNLPSKRDINGLARRVNRLNKKVDALHRAVAA